MPMSRFFFTDFNLPTFKERVYILMLSKGASTKIGKFFGTETGVSQVTCEITSDKIRATLL